MLDRNKTALTHRVTATAARYLTDLGFCAVVGEVSVGTKRVADLAGYWSPSRSDVHRLFRGPALIQAEEVYVDSRDRVLTMVAEVKTTRADFLADVAKWSEPLAEIRFLAFPKGVVESAEIPDGWFAIQTTDDVSNIGYVYRQRGRYTPMPTEASLSLVAQIAHRCDARTRCRALDDYDKQARADRHESTKQFRAAQLLHGLAKWLRADSPRGLLGTEESLRDVVRYMGIKEIPRYCDEAIEYFEDLRCELASVRNVVSTGRKGKAEALATCRAIVAALQAAAAFPDDDAADAREERAFEALIVLALRMQHEEGDVQNLPELNEKERAALDSLGPDFIDRLLAAKELHDGT